MEFDLIVAINNDGLIGIREYGEYNIPWQMIKEDIEFFKNTTTKTDIENQINVVIIGYNTWNSLSKNYKKNNKRKNIVISKKSDIDIPSDNEIYVASFEKALEYANNLENVCKIFVAGGSKIYHEALCHPKLKNIHISHIKTNYPKDNQIEYEIYFPLDFRQIKYLESTGSLIILSKKEGYELNKDIMYTIYTYKISDNFRPVYQQMDKLENRAINILPPSPINNQTGEYQYINLVRSIMDNGITKKTRNAITKSIFGYQMKYDLKDGYPISTVKKSYPKSIFEELMWMVRGQTNSKILESKGVNIWKKNSSKNFLEKCGLPYDEGDIGPGYGFQMRHFGAEYVNCHENYKNKGFDQLNECIKLINNEPHSRRIMINLWNCVDTNKVSLPPCHVIYHFTVDLYDEVSMTNTVGKLNCHLFQRSWDVLLGWNTTTAALLTYLLASHCNLDPGMLVHSISDAHLYQEHINSGAVEKLLQRIPRKMPTIRFLRKRDNIEDYEYSDIALIDYYPCPSIIAEMVA